MLEQYQQSIISENNNYINNTNCSDISTSTLITTPFSVKDILNMNISSNDNSDYGLSNCHQNIIKKEYGEHISENNYNQFWEPYTSNNNEHQYYFNSTSSNIYNQNSDINLPYLNKNIFGSTTNNDMYGDNNNLSPHVQQLSDMILREPHHHPKIDSPASEYLS